MTEFHLPKDGSIIVIDDKIGDALPIINLLSSKGIASTYYNGGDDNDLPAHPMQKARLIFCDIQLVPNLSSHDNAQIIARLLDRLITDNNGPYVLALWSGRLTDHVEEVKHQILAPNFNKRPLCVIELNKAEYLRTHQDSSDVDLVLEALQADFEDSIENDDLNRIKTKLEELIPKAETKELTPNAMDNLLEDLSTKLKSHADAFQLFTIWESAINQSSKIIVHDYSGLHPELKNWSENIKYTMSRMARAQSVEENKPLSKEKLFEYSLMTLNQTFLDQVDNDVDVLSDLSSAIEFDSSNIKFTKELAHIIYQISWNAADKQYLFLENGTVVAQHKKSDRLLNAAKSNWSEDRQRQEEIESIFKEYDSAAPKINTKLHTDLSPMKNPCPGNVYEVIVSDDARRTQLLSTYLKLDSQCLQNPDDDDEASRSTIQSVKFIEVDVTPGCDIAQSRVVKSRVLPGILLPESCISSFRNLGSNYKTPPIRLRNQNFHLIVDFRLFKSTDSETLANKTPCLRLRQELHTDIVSKLSNHVNSFGIAFVE